jgi:DNA-directed RNA polymerase specialized sigma subunit
MSVFFNLSMLKIPKTFRVRNKDSGEIFSRIEQTKKTGKRLFNICPLVKYIVGRMRVNLPSTISTEDLAGYGG